MLRFKRLHHELQTRMAEVIEFDKYDRFGAYHWVECDRRYANHRRYNPALDARYELTLRKIEQLGIRGSVLDVGCGDGYLMGRLAQTMVRVVGVDSEPTAIRWAQDKLRSFPNCEAIQTACYDLPFPNHTFDLATSADVIEHLKDPVHHLKEIGRVLKLSGALVLTTPKWRADRKWDTRHEKEYCPDELRALLEQSFDTVEMSYFWPLKWSNFYSTRVGWRLLKLIAVGFYNPFLRQSGAQPERFGQMMAVCRKPIAV
jgi:SAM-dependent methyltransferase